MALRTPHELQIPPSCLLGKEWRDTRFPLMSRRIGFSPDVAKEIVQYGMETLNIRERRNRAK